jgi:soluble lytic murein transglycosylase
MRLLPWFLPVILSAVSAFAGEFPDDAFPAKSGLEQKYRDARVLESVGDPEAVTLYRQLAKASAFPAPDAVQWALARLAPPEKAEKYWRAVLDAQPRSPFVKEAVRGLRALFLKRGRLPEAEAMGRRLLESARSDAERASALGALLPLLESQGKWEELRQTAKRLWIEFPQFRESRVAEAQVAPGASPFDAVSPEELLARGKRLLDRGSREEAVRTFVELKRRLPAGSPIGPELDLSLGKALVLLRRYDEAREPLAAARLDAGREEEARYQMDRALFGLNRGDEGAADLVDLARGRPAAARAPNYLLQAQRVFDGRRLWRQARRAENLLLRRYPRSSEAREVYWAKGWSAYREGRYAEAADRFWSSRQGVGREWSLAQALYWQGRALLELGEVDAGSASLEAVVRSFPLGYYAELSANVLEGKPSGPMVSDPRSSKDVHRALTSLLPAGDELEPKKLSESESRAETYLRLGLPAAAREVLRGASGGTRKARLLYWAEDFQGALAASGSSWLNWPADADPLPLEPEGLAYPIAYPRSASAAAQEAGIHPHLLLAIAHTESHFDPGAYSSAEARGLMQFIPSTGKATARAVGIQDFSVDRLYEPTVALRLGARHLRELLDRFHGDTVLAVAAYNAGAGAVERWRKSFGELEPSMFVETIPYKETRRYVKKVLTALDAYGRLDPPGILGAQSP